MASNNPTFELGFFDDIQELDNVSEMVETSETSDKSKVLPGKTTASQIYPSGIWRKFSRIKNQRRPRKTLTGVFPRSRVSFKLK